MQINQARQQVFSKLCAVYKRSDRQHKFSARAEDIRRELRMSEKDFYESLRGFVDVNGASIVETVERIGEYFLSLGEPALFNLND